MANIGTTEPHSTVTINGGNLNLFTIVIFVEVSVKSAPMLGNSHIPVNSVSRFCAVLPLPLALMRIDVV